MSRRYQSLGKRDANEAEILRALREVGCDVVSGTDCDLYVNTFDGPLLMEIKIPGQESALTALQLRLKAIFGEQYVVVSSVAAALEAVGAL